MADLAGNMFNQEATVLASRIPVDIQRRLMVYALEAAIEKHDNSDEVQNFSEALGLGVDDVLTLLGLYMSIIRFFMQSDEKEFRQAMVTAGFSLEFIENFPLKRKKQPVSLILSGSYVAIQKLSSFKWRVDISFPCGVLMKQVPPAVIISLSLNNGRKYVLELDQFAFHRLRFDLSLAFKEYINLKKSILLKNMILP